MTAGRRASWRFPASALLLALGAAPAVAQAPPGPVPLPASDPATLAEARLVVAKLMPPGFYRTVMKASMAPVIDSIGDTLDKMPLRQIVEASGLDAAQAARLDHVDMARVMAIYDPAWKERQRLTMQAMIAAMGNFFDTQEPQLREAMAVAYTHRFTLADLTALDRFFETPAGAKFAHGYMTIMTDPTMIAATKAMMPRMMEHMPEFMAAAQKATAGLPPPRKIGDLNAADRRELANALGMAPGDLHPAKSK